MPIFEFDREGRARKDLFYRTKNLKRRLFEVFADRPLLARAGFGSRAAAGYDLLA